jgi:hypothetical protein
MWKIVKRNIKKDIDKVFKKIRNKAISKLFGYKGTFKILIENPLTLERTQIAQVDNLIMDWTLNTLIKALMGECPIDAGAQIMHFAIGTDNTAPTASDETLGTEVYRVPVAARTNTSNGVVTHEFYLLATDYSGSIEEMGIFGGEDSEDWEAGAGKDTGHLLARALWSYTKSSSEQIVVQRVDTLLRES